MFLTAALILISVLTVFSLTLAAIALRRVGRNRDCVLEELALTRQRVQQAEQELAALCSAAAGAGDHVLTLEQQVQRILERQNLQELRSGGERPYTRASQLVHKGADIEELVDSCGLTQGEAELLVMMQRGVA